MESTPTPTPTPVHPQTGGKRLPQNYFDTITAAAVSDSEDESSSSASSSSSSSEDEACRPSSSSSPPDAKKAKKAVHTPDVIVDIARKLSSSDEADKKKKEDVPAAAVCHRRGHSSRRNDRRKKRTLEIVNFFNVNSTKARACGKCAGCRAAPCGQCGVCKRNASMTAEMYKKSKRRCVELRCDNNTAADIVNRNESVILRGELYHIRPALTKLEEGRMKWAKTAYEHAGTEKGEFARRMRDVQFRQILFLLKEFNPELRRASPESEKMMHRFIDKKKAKYVRKS